MRSIDGWWWITVDPMPFFLGCLASLVAVLMHVALEHYILWSGYDSSQIGKILRVGLNDVECYEETSFVGYPKCRIFWGSPFPAGPVKDLAELTDKLWSKSHGLPQATEARRASVDTLGAWTYPLLEPWKMHGCGICEVKYAFTWFSRAFPMNKYV